MGLLDSVGELGSAIIDRGKAIGETVGSSAESFAKGVADKASAFSNSTVGQAATNIAGIAGGILGGPVGAIAGAFGTVSSGLADPASFVEGILGNARGIVSKAFNLSKSVIDKVMVVGGGAIRSLMDNAIRGAQVIARSVAQGVGVLANTVIRGFLAGLHMAETAGLRLLKFDAGLAKSAIAAQAQIRVAVIHNITSGLRTLGIMASTKMMHGVQVLANLKRAQVTKTMALAVQASNKAAQFAIQTAQQAQMKVTKAALTANAMIQSAVAKIAPFLPGPLKNIAARASALSAEYSTKAIAYASFAGTSIQSRVIAANVRLQTAIIQHFTASLARANEIERSLNSEIMGLTFGGVSFLTNIESALTSRILRKSQAVQDGIDRVVGAIEMTAHAITAAADQHLPAVAQGVAEGAVGLERKGEELIGEGVGVARKAIAKKKEGLKTIIPGLKNAGKGILSKGFQIGEQVIERGLAFTTGLLDPTTQFSQAAQPSDGQLTGPFMPGEPMVPPEQALALHGRSNPTARESIIAGGAAIFVNGIDTSLAEHYRAAQRLANELGQPVVGVYNASGGMGTDLIQCAADKMFDRSGNPAVATVARLVKTYGDAKKPKGGMNIFAHSQGSLIVSEALRQAAKAGADLRQNEVTTFGNAAFTFPQGPQYHHYIHDDDAVSMSVGTGSAISNLMNNTFIGRMLSGALLGPTANAGQSTTVLHHGGSMIGPHAVNAADGNDYIGHLQQFRAQEASKKPVGAAMPTYRRTLGAATFAIARGIGSMASGAVASGYRGVSSAISGLPSLPFLPPNTMWGAIDARMRAFGGGLQTAGAAYGAGNDAYYGGMSRVQRSGYTPLPYDADATEVEESLSQSGDPGFRPDTTVREKLAPHLGFDPSDAKIHTGPSSAAAARDLGAQAFTIGSDVFFGAGQYDPASSKGMSLIAHELTHVGQQTGAIGNPLRFMTQHGGDSMEYEAQRVATNVLMNTGTPQGLQVEKLNRTYDCEEGVGQEDVKRLDRITEMAIRIAETTLGKKNGIVEAVNVNVDLDLGTMSDSVAARIISYAIIEQVNLRPVKANPTLPAPKRIQKDDRTPPAQERLRTLPADVERAIQQDADAIVAELKSWSVNRALIISLISRWAGLDGDTKNRYQSSSPHLDYLLMMLQIRSWDAGYIATQYVCAVDALFREFAGTSSFADMFRGYVRNSEKYKSYRPDDMPESAGSYVGRHVLMGVLGIIKALSGALMGLGQAAIWATWKSKYYERQGLVKALTTAQKLTGSNFKEYIDFFGKDDPPKADEEIAERFDFMAKALIDCFDIDPAEKKAMMEDFSFANKWGAIPANLMMLGAGGGGLTSKGAQSLLKMLMILQSASAIETSYKAMQKRMEEIFAKNPNATWWDVMSDGEVLKQMTTVVVSAIATASGLGEASGKAKSVMDALAKFGYAGDFAQLAPIVKLAYEHWNDKSLKEEDRKAKLEQDAIDFINQAIALGNSTATKVKEHREAAKAKAEAAAAQAPAAAAGPAAPAAPGAPAAPEAAPVPAAPVEVKAAPAPAEGKVAAPVVSSEPQATVPVEAPAPKATEAPPTPREPDAKPAPEAAPPANDPPPTSTGPKEPSEFKRRASFEDEQGPARNPDEPYESPKQRAQREEAQQKVADAKESETRQKLTQTENDINSLRERLNDPSIDPDGRAKMQKRLEKLERKAARLQEELPAATTKPAISETGKSLISAVASGNVEAALQMIKSEKGWKSKLKEAMGEGGDFFEQAKQLSGGDEAKAKAMLESIGKTLDLARQQVIDTARKQVLAGHPDIEFDIPGTPGFKSDKDITARPTKEALAKLQSITDPTLKAQELARLVEASGKVVDEMNKVLADSTKTSESDAGGIPDKTLDTNMYSWTGAEIKFDLPPAQQKMVNRSTDVASLAEIRRQMSGPEWEAFKKRAIEKTGDWEQMGGDKMAQEMRKQFADAEKISSDLEARTKQEMDKIRKSKPGESDEAVTMEARAVVAKRLNERLVELMKTSPVPFDEIASLQAQIKMVEPGAYASQAGIEDVVGAQQPRARKADEIFKAREELEKLRKEGADAKKLDDQSKKIQQLEQEAKDQYFGPVFAAQEKVKALKTRNAPADEVARAEADLQRIQERAKTWVEGTEMSPRDMSQSAASTLAQFETHAPGKHGASRMTEIEAETAVKDAYKYSGRIALLESQLTGRPVDLPDVANYSRAQLRSLVERWAAETGRDWKRPFPDLAAEYAQARLEWSREAVSNLKVEAMAADLHGVPGKGSNTNYRPISPGEKEDRNASR